LLSSLYFVRRFMFELFLKIHLLLALIAMGSLLWHLLPGNFVKVLFPTIALFLWVSNMLYQLYFGGRAHQVFITKLYTESNYQNISAIKLKLVLKQPIIIKPGQYLYLRILSDLQSQDRFQAHPFMIAWWDELAPVETSKREVSVASSSAKDFRGEDESLIHHAKAKSLTFLIQPQRGLSARLAMQSSIRSVAFDGPYGQDLHLERYETVMLVAQGIGIAGVLPYAHHLTNWKFHKNKSHKRAVMTRKLDLYWLLEENYQEKWIGDYLKELQQKDIKQVSFFLHK
jgi:predicted ferric reductase